jgi:DNA gyrase subunit A
VEDYRRTNRGGTGIINIKLTDRNGKVTGLKGVSDDGDLMLITRRGIIIRSDLAKISTIGRSTRGVKLITLDEEDYVIDLALCEKEEEEPHDEPGTVLDDAAEKAVADESGDADEQPEAGSENESGE